MGLKKRVGVLVSGGDAPGVNAVIRAATYRAAEEGIEVVGLYDGWSGLLDHDAGETLRLTPELVRTWDRDGGSNLGASPATPFRHRLGERYVDRSAEVYRNVERLELDAVIALAGADTLGVAHRFAGHGLPVVVIPKTIGKDIALTDYTVGFDSAARTVGEVVERARTPAGSHHWVQVIEVIGRSTGHLALWGGHAAGAALILIPEAPYDLGRVIGLLDEQLHPEQRNRRYPRYAVVVAAEGAHAVDEGPVTLDERRDSYDRPRIGGVGARLAHQIAQETPHETRSLALGALQRGGSPSHLDRNMGWLFGVAAVEAVLQRRWGAMIATRGVAPCCELSLVPLGDALGGSSGVDVARHYDPERYSFKRRGLLGSGS